ncbi:MAG TPA: YqgE/AlgH family protein [Bryobacteraceae bacterium]|nr:YqgE/AlgH family protein [Bryobacteraceae bacterium]
MAWRFRAALFVLALAQAAQPDELAPGKFLVASKELGDPNFAESVVLLLQYDAGKGAMGLIINRRTDVPLSRLFEDFKEAKGRSDSVYLGGPVELSNVLALLRSAAKPEDAKLVFGDVYLVTSKDLLQKTLASKVEAARFHAYVGYAGWGPGQLEREIALGAWKILPAEAGIVFHADPDSVWKRLISRTETQIARADRYSERNVAIGSTFVARRAGR